ncbi:MAG: T9SS type A sorting domain-containing protein [Ignavibacteriota bacterium]
MKNVIRITIFLFVFAGAFSTVNAQEWEKIGWEGGGQVEIKAQLGNTLYGLANFSVYKSTDWGKSWFFFHNGLPEDTFFFSRNMKTQYYHNSGITQCKDYLIIGPCIDNNSNTGRPFGFYYCKEREPKWTFKPLSRLPRDGMLHIFYFSGDSIFVYENYVNNDSGGFYLSQDGGSSWERRMSTLTLMADQAGANPYSLRSSFFIFSDGKTFRTPNFGLTWDSLQFRPSTNWSDWWSLDDSIILQYYVKESSSHDTSITTGIYRTIDFGTSWEEIPDFPRKLPAWDVIQFIRKVGKKSFLFTDYNSSFMLNNTFVSDDFGGHWKRITSIDSNLWIQGIFGYDNFYILKTYWGNFTTDSTFLKLTPLISSKKEVYGNQRALVGVKGKNLFALPDARQHSLYDSVLRSTDNGSSWSQEQFFGKGLLDNNRWVPDGSILYSSGIKSDSSPCIFKSLDDGISWVIDINVPTKERVLQYFIQGDTVVVRSHTNIFNSIDGGISWIRQSPTIGDSVNMAYRDGMIEFLDLRSGTTFFTIDMTNWHLINPFYPTPIQVVGPYLYGGRSFELFQSVPNIPISLNYRIREDTHFQSCEGLPTFGAQTFPNADDNGILFAPSSYDGWVNYETGYSSLYYSLDSGSNWKKFGDNVTDSREVFIGSDYIFLAGPNELWRLPKSALPLKVQDAKNISSSIGITGCFPNPASSSTRISYSIPSRSDVRLEVFDIMGREVANIVSGVRDAGSYDAEWDTRALPAGSYIIRFTSGGENVSKVVEVAR